MAMINPVGRANYEPNSWAEQGGPRENPEVGFRSVPAEESGARTRLRPEAFADHYSQARQFYISQTAVEQQHIASALTFELSKVETPAIRARMVAHLRNIDDELAKRVASGLGLSELPEPAKAAKPTRRDLERSPALSILDNGPDRFEGRKLGILVADGFDAEVFRALCQSVEKAGASYEVIAPEIFGARSSAGEQVMAKQAIAGGPSVLYDAVALLVPEAMLAEVAALPEARDFVADAYAHAKLIGYVPSARPLFARAGLADRLDEGCIELDAKRAQAFVERCGELRYWPRERGS
jgi:catalase